MSFVIRLPISRNWKGETHNSILVIVNQLQKTVHYKPVKIIIHALYHAKVIIYVVVLNHDFLDLILSNPGSVFIPKFLSLFCYFPGIKIRLSIAFYPETDGKTEKSNSTIEDNLRAFVNYKQSNQPRLLSIVEFHYKNAKNATTIHTPFEPNCGFYLWVLYKKDVDSCSKSWAEHKIAAR